MREILFRGKRVDNGKWVYGYYFKATHHWNENGIHEDWIATDAIQNGGWCNVRGKYAVIPETVSEFTGLTGRNGTKIFEGDICQMKDISYMDDTPFVIEWSNEYSGWYRRDLDHASATDVFTPGIAHTATVIGNIHDNPDLVKGE